MSIINSANLFNVYPADRVAVFIDGANLYAALKRLDQRIDYKLLRSAIANSCRLVRITYYTAMLDTNEYNHIKPMVDFLENNGFSISTKPVKEYTDKETGVVRIKGNMDIEIAVDMFEAAPHIDHMILFSGDGDFKYLVNSLQRQGKKITVVSTRKTSISICSMDLKRQADEFIDLDDLKSYLSAQQ